MDLGMDTLNSITMCFLDSARIRPFFFKASTLLLIVLYFNHILLWMTCYSRAQLDFCSIVRTWVMCSWPPATSKPVL